MSVNHISEIIGEFGKWQLNIAAFYFIIYIVSPFNNFGITFHAPNVKYWCSDNTTGADSLNITNIYSYLNESNACTDCKEWSYEDTYGTTIISEFDLVCDKSWLPSLSQSIFQLGYVVNGLILGYLSDRFGRRPVLWFAITVEICSGISVILSQSMIQYIISRFFLGLGDSGRGVCLYLLVFETVGPKYRADLIMIISFGSTIGYTLLPGFAYLANNFRLLQLIPTMIAMTLWLTWLWTIPESPRWQLCNGQIDCAKQSLKRAAKINGRTISEDMDEKFENLKNIAKNREQNDNRVEEKSKHLTIISLLGSPVLRKYSLIFWFSFAVNAFIYHGISLNVEQIGGNLFVNFAIAGLVEIPSILLNLIGLRYLGRKWFTVWTMLLASISYLSIVLLNVLKASIGEYFETLNLLFAMIGKLFIFSSFNAIYIHSGEVFPTVLRHTAIGSCSIAARIGSILAPFVKEMSEYSNFGLSMLVFGLLSFTATLLTLFLPETRNREIPDNIYDVQELTIKCAEERPLISQETD